MSLTITDDELRAMKLSAEEARIEIACRLFDAEKLDFHDARRLAGLDRVGFEEALYDRRIPLFRPTVEDLEQDLEGLRRMGV